MYRDPTMERAAKRESRSCHGCIQRTRLWGATYCAKGKWEGINNERRCDQWDSGLSGIKVIKQ